MHKIFLIEDDPLMARFYERTLKLNNYAIEVALDGEEAIAKLAMMEEKPTLILLDLMMPKLSGFDVLRHLKQKDELRNIPVVVLTNLAKQEYVDKAIELGAVTYLVKGQYTAKEVVAKVAELIEAHAPSPPPEIPTTGVPIRDLPHRETSGTQAQDEFQL
jgi:DNA-binding response OmpR family regulator